MIENRNSTCFNPDGDVIFGYPGYFDIRSQVAPLSSDIAPALNDPAGLRMAALDLEYQADCVHGLDNQDKGAQSVESRIYIEQPRSKPSPEHTRGIVTCMSSKSATRLKKLMNRTLGLSVWIDLTFADDVISGLQFPDRVAFSYSCLNQFQRVLRARGIHYIWKKEIERRKSGDFIGARVPHYHIVLCGLSEDQKNNWQKLCIELLTIWVGITGTQHPKALQVALKTKNGVPQSFRLISNVKVAIRYISKYFSKTFPVVGRDETKEPESIGRCWGNSKGLPVAAPCIIHLRPEESVKFRRFFRKLINPPKNSRFFGLREQLIKGFSTFIFFPLSDLQKYVDFLCDYDYKEPLGHCPF